MAEHLLKEFDEFIDTWKDTGAEMKAVVVELKEFLASMEGVSLSFKGRPGVSYSIRPRHHNQKGRDLFAMVDVIDDNPEERWLSICFYGDMITDPDGAGDLVPGGLLGEDGYCFDLYESDEEEVAYLKNRLVEACRSASK